MNNYSTLKQKHRARRENFPNDLSVRIHRALSWLERAEKEISDPDASFIFHWISFNAAYSGNISEEQGYSEKSAFYSFFEQISKHDERNEVYTIIWERFSQEVRGILSNKYIFSSYWRHSNGDDDSFWENSFHASIQKTNNALASQDNCTILSILFSRIYVLRNQIFHGNATWNGRVNRSQVKDCQKLLAVLLPCLLNIMMDNPDKEWGELAYPIKGND